MICVEASADGGLRIRVQCQVNANLTLSITSARRYLFKTCRYYSVRAGVALLGVAILFDYAKFPILELPKIARAPVFE